MALTIDDITAIVTGRIEPLTVAIYDLDLSDSFGYAIRQAGGTVVSATSPTDDDLLTVTASDDAVLDLAELRTLKTLYQNATAVNSKAGDVSANESELPARLWQRIMALEADIQRTHGIGGGAGITFVDVTYTGTETSDEYSRPPWFWSTS